MTDTTTPTLESLSASLATAIERIDKLEADIAKGNLDHADNVAKINANSTDIDVMKADFATVAGSVAAVTRGDYAGAGMTIVGNWAAIVETAHRLEMVINRFWPSLFPPRVNKLDNPPTQQQTTEAAQDARAAS